MSSGDKGPAVGPIETMVPGLSGQKVTMVPGLTGQKVHGDKGPAVGPIGTKMEVRSKTNVHEGLTRSTP